MKNLFRNKLIYYAFATLFIVVFFISSLWYHHYTTTIDNDRFSSFMLSYSLYSQDMKELETEKIQQRYTGIHSTDIAKSKVFVATDNTTREFAIFETTGSQSTDNIQKVLGSYCKSMNQKTQKSIRVSRATLLGEQEIILF